MTKNQPSLGFESVNTYFFFFFFFSFILTNDVLIKNNFKNVFHELYVTD